MNARPGLLVRTVSAIAQTSPERSLVNTSVAVRKMVQRLGGSSWRSSRYRPAYTRYACTRRLRLACFLTRLKQPLPRMAGSERADINAYDHPLREVPAASASQSRLLNESAAC
jgi:hypothetical protein